VPNQLGRVIGLCQDPGVGAARLGRVRTGACALGVGLLVALASCSTPSRPAPPAPGPAPTEGPLVGWQLTLPVPNSKGGADVVKPARVSPPWLTTDASGALVFWAPVNGVTTPNSPHARTELGRMEEFAAGTGPHTLTASVTVSQVPTEVPSVIIGQIHGAGDISSVPFVMLFYNGGALKVIVKQEQSGEAKNSYPLLTDVPLGARFDYGISQNADGSLTFMASYDGHNAKADAPVPAAFTGASVRFQAGAYQQANSTDGTAAADDGARVTFSSIAVGPTAGS
jgi:hypothetical protein